MSRIGRMPIPVPSGVTVDIVENAVTSKGPKGSLSYTHDSRMTVVIADNQLVVSRPSDSKEHKAIHGLTRTLIYNIVVGVSEGFEKTLEIVGVGYRAEQTGANITLRVGFSHPVIIEPLPGLTLTAEGNNRIKVSGIDKQMVGEMAARIRAIRPPDSYKGKGVRYAREAVRLKPGKAGKVAGR